MLKRFFWLTLWLAACGATPAPTLGVPTAILRPLPSSTFTPVLPTLASLPTTTVAPTLAPWAEPMAASPTPVVYVVQSGDTLIGIAVRFNITLEALEALNLGLDPANLQPGQTLIIPPGGVDSAAPLTAPTLAPLSVTADPFTCQTTPAASLICLSEFVNSTNDSIVNLAVQATLTNDDGAVGSVGVAYSPLDLIPPGAAVPLAVVFPAPASGRQAVASVAQADSGAGLADRFTLLTVNDLNGVPTEGGFTVNGIIANSFPANVHSIVVIATVYNSSGSVAGYRKITLEEPLAANADAAFSIALPGVGDVARWAAIAQGRTR
ncbi:MAG: LysM peptidoglycan-binding domain-containing protein [Chloroflexi bacterium]|nr:LysM peptidoglycan-binding domain-containing protein [Chloroflexota bacterium]